MGNIEDDNKKLTILFWSVAIRVELLVAMTAFTVSIFVSQDNVRYIFIGLTIVSALTIAYISYKVRR